MGYLGTSWLLATPYSVTLISVGLEVIAVGLLAYSFLFTISSAAFPYPRSLPSVVGALCTIASGTMQRRHVLGCLHTPMLYSVLAHPKVVYIGKLSYPLYLWHWPVLVIMRTSATLDSWPNKIAAAAITFWGAQLLYHVIEAPFRRWRPRRKYHVLLVFLPILIGLEMWLGILRAHPSLVQDFTSRLSLGSSDAGTSASANKLPPPAPRPPPGVANGLPAPRPPPSMPPPSPPPPPPIPFGTPLLPPSPLHPPPPLPVGKGRVSLRGDEVTAMVSTVCEVADVDVDVRFEDAWEDVSVTLW